MPLARTLPSVAYLADPARHKQELSLLRGQWAILAHEGAVPKSGDNLAIDLFGCPVLLRRGMDGTVAAYLNTCPHRGGPIAWGGSSNSRLLQCRYHGWTFKPDGGLIEPVGLGHERAAVRCAEPKLRRLDIAVSQGLILTRLAMEGEEAPPPALPTELASRLSRATLVSVAEFPASCNWKLYAENWLEAYHLTSLHKGLSDDIQRETYRVSAGANWAEHSARPDKGTYGGYWAFLYPATAINFFIDGFSIEHISPVTEETCAVRYQFYRFTESGRQDGIAAEIALTRIVTGEDIAAAEHVQKCLSAGIFDSGFVSAEREPGVLALYDFLARHTCMDRDI